MRVMAIGDLNNDGTSDLAMGSYSNSRISASSGAAYAPQKGRKGSTPKNTFAPAKASSQPPQSGQPAHRDAVPLEPRDGEAVRCGLVAARRREAPHGRRP